MKKLFIAFLALVLLGAISFLLILLFTNPDTTLPSQKKETQSQPTPTASPQKSTTTPEVEENTQSMSQGIGSSWIIVRDIKKISLVPNFEEGLSSKEVFEKNGCFQLTSGGFVDT